MLYLLQFNLHLVQGKPPKFLDINQLSAEQMSQVDTYLKKYKRSLKHNHRALQYLQRLIRFYTQQFPGSLRKEVRLESWFGLERDLRQDIQAGQFRIATLQHQSKVLRHFRKTRKQRQQQRKQGAKLLALHQQSLRISQRQQTLETTMRAVIRKASKERQRTQHNQQRMAKAIEEVQQQYLATKRQLEQRKQRAPIVLWSGVAGLVVGASSLAAGILVYAQAGQNIQLAPREVGYLQRVGTGVAIGGGALSILGGVSVLLGWSMQPTPAMKDQAMLKAHQHYLDFRKSNAQTLWTSPSP